MTDRGGRQEKRCSTSSADLLGAAIEAVCAELMEIESRNRSAPNAASGAG
jgi:hypothetical protein